MFFQGVNHPETHQLIYVGGQMMLLWFSTWLISIQVGQTSRLFFIADVRSLIRQPEIRSCVPIRYVFTERNSIHWLRLIHGIISIGSFFCSSTIFWQFFSVLDNSLNVGFQFWLCWQDFTARFRWFNFRLWKLNLVKTTRIKLI